MDYARDMLQGQLETYATRCRICGRTEPTISENLGVCTSCIRERPEDALVHVGEAHATTRKRFGLPESPPTGEGIPCKLCANECSMKNGEKGFCGLRSNTQGKLRSESTTTRALVSYYRDPHVTNCCNNWFCPAGTGAGYPDLANREGAEIGYENLAIFLYGCNFNCLFCQNWTHKSLEDAPTHRDDDLISQTLGNPRISCWCFFGGSPEPQLPFTISASRKLLEQLPRDRILRICYEWNGCGNKSLAKRAAEIALTTGGNIKFDLKTFDPNLSLALSGVNNQRAYQNFEMIYDTYYDEREDLPLLSATTLLVPGYVDSSEVEAIAAFLGDLDPDIPYNLLVFHPSFLMRDLPITPRKQVDECLSVARRHLTRVNLGNRGLLQGYGIQS